MSAQRHQSSDTGLRNVLARVALSIWIALPAAFLTAAPIALSQQAPTASAAREAASLPAEPPSPYRITGVVIDSITKSPIPNVSLTAEPMATVRQSRRSRRRVSVTADSVTTDAEGRFELTVASAGGWSLSASTRGYRAQALDEHDGYSTAVILTNAAPQFNLTFRMTPASIIQGFVLDEGGEPVRAANVSLVYLPPATPGNQHPRPQNRAQQMTDDRGFYKFSAIGEGTYEIRVTAYPWYASNSPQSGFSVYNRPGPPQADPSDSGPDPLDVVYPAVWFPGVIDPAAATPITLHGGETQEANFRLLPLPGSHLRIAGPGTDTATGPDSQPMPPNTYLTRLLPDGSEESQLTPTRMDGRGNADIAGLAPGTYLVHQQLQGSSVVSLSTIQVGAGSPRTLDLSEGVPAPTVTVKVDPAADQDSLQISFRDLDTGHTLYAQRLQDVVRQPLRRRADFQADAASPDSHTPRPDRTVSLPPGKYEVHLSGINDLHLASIEATGATATGRIVTIGTGTPKLLLHTAAGFGTVIGFVTVKGQPDPGAMVMLIPATLGNPSGLDIPARDQSNSDGSFEMGSLLPGGYILIAIDHGWDVNWSDPATLRRFLMHGVPVDIKPGSDLKLTIEAQSP